LGHIQLSFHPNNLDTLQGLGWERHFHSNEGIHMSYRAFDRVVFFLLFSSVALLSGCGNGSVTSTAKSTSQNNGAQFTVTSATSALTIYPGSTQTLTATIGGSSTVPISVTLTNVPTGITVTSSPATVMPGNTATLTITASVNADAAAFPATWYNNPNSATTNVLVSAAAGGLVATAPLALTVSESAGAKIDHVAPRERGFVAV
jgi:hypothetical protein